MNEEQHEKQHERIVDELDAVWTAIGQRETEALKILKELEELKKKG